jgi:iron complex transport system ATP-binding protein
MAGIIRVQGVTTHYNTTEVLQDICFEIEKGDFVGIVGPNGSGKTTLLNNLGRLVPYQTGWILLNEKNLLTFRHKEAARMMSAVTQNPWDDIDFQVYDVVMMGRTPHWGFFPRETEEDRNIVAGAMKMAGVQKLADRKLSELSGGERQRVFIAQAIAQKPEVMLLDEPTSHLDIHYQISIMDALKRLNESQQVTIIGVLHDLNLAAQYCNKILILKEGKIAGFGSPREVLQIDLIEAVYQCKVAVATHPVTGTPYVVLYSRASALEIDMRERAGVKIHIISGGGSGVALMEAFASKGYAISAGVLNIGDSDWQKGQELKIPMIEEMPFSNISLDKKEENLSVARKSEVVIVAATPFGAGNLPNAEVLLQLAESGMPIILIDGNNVGERDYTGGKAEDIFLTLLQNPHVHSICEKDATELLLRLIESR